MEEELWKTLNELTEAEFKNFKWFLRKDSLEGFSGIPVARLEKADQQTTVDLMVQKYQGPGALRVTLTALEKISRNDLVRHLENSCSRLKDRKLREDLKNLDSVPLKRDYERKKAKLVETEAEIKLMIQERQMKIEEIKRSAELSSKSADRHIADSVQVFTVLQESVKKSLDDLIEAIEDKRKTTKKEAEGFIHELKQEISALTKRSTEVEQLSRNEDHLNFLESSESLNIPATKSWTKVSLSIPTYGGSVGTAVGQLQEKLSEEKDKLFAKAKLNRVRQFEKDVTLDPDTANPKLILSDDGKQVYCGDVKQNLPDNSERFNPAINVLGKQSFSSGRFYYEVRVEGKTSWDLGVVKESINRKGLINASTENGYWTICLRNGDRYQAFGVNLRVKCKPKKVGVFVDYEKGSVSFYDVDSADVIYCFTECSFTEKLFPFFSPSLHYDDRNSTPLIISPVDYTD
ncbi:E3 ubiquitin-protein ligase TRIM21-like [Enoplosus armatus]|uniref:E3 ubiquitin-protein ligase TRIM21-like n=1 Tax=Enoplosus armatus TaxID=215367 RepID=UPI003995ED61